MVILHSKIVKDQLVIDIENIIGLLMKIAFAGKGGVGKTSITAWTADYLARQGQNVWLVDADTALSLGRACGVEPEFLPEPLVGRVDLINEFINSGGFLNLNPDVGSLPDFLAVPVSRNNCDEKKDRGTIRLLVMGAVSNAGGGCACSGNALLKAVLSHLIMEENDWVLVDLEAGVEHLGRGTVAHVDKLVIVSEPSYRSLETAKEVSRMGHDLELHNQILVMNKSEKIDGIAGNALPEQMVCLPHFQGLAERQLTNPSVLDLAEQEEIDSYIKEILSEVQN